jgi:hypothetical protein
LTQGNGQHGPSFFRSLVRRATTSLPAGPFRGTDIVLVLEAEGWEREATDDSTEWRIYRRSGSSARVPVNPEWVAIWENDPAFACLGRDMGLTPTELAALLRSYGVEPDRRQ